MPSAAVASLGKKAGKTAAEAEELWQKAKRAAKKAFGVDEPAKGASEAQRSKFFRITMGLFKGFLGLRKKRESLSTAKFRLITEHRILEVLRGKRKENLLR